MHAAVKDRPSKQEYGGTGRERKTVHREVEGQVD